MIDVGKVYDPIIFTFSNCMYAYAIKNNVLSRVSFGPSDNLEKFITSEGGVYNLKDILVFRGSVELNAYTKTHPLEDKLYIVPIHILDFVKDTLNNIILLDSEYWVKEFGCRNIDEVFKQHNYLEENGKVVVQIGSDINNIPLSLNILFDTLGNLDSVETARKVIDDIDDLCD